MTDYEMPQGLNEEKEGVVYGDLVTFSYDSQSVGVRRKALVLLPPEYDPDKAYPIVFLLHGIGGDETEWMPGNPRALIGNMIHMGSMVPRILVFPNVRARENDAKDPDDIFTMGHIKSFDYFIHDLTRDLFPAIKKVYKIRDGRENTWIGGLSMGGREALYIGFSHLELFGKIGAFTPAFGILPYTNQNGSEPGLIDKDDLKFKPPYEETSLHLMTGQSDGVVKSEPYRYHAVFMKNKVPHLYYETPGGHEMKVWMDGLYNFMKLG